MNITTIKFYYVNRLIIGFIGKTECRDKLLPQPMKHFLLRYSDSEIGGLTIACKADKISDGLFDLYISIQFIITDYDYFLFLYCCCCFFMTKKIPKVLENINIKQKIYFKTRSLMYNFILFQFGGLIELTHLYKIL